MKIIRKIYNIINNNEIKLSIIIIFIGIFFISINYIADKRVEVYDMMNMIFFKENPKDVVINLNKPIIEQKNNKNYNDYIGILEIPSINFKKGFYSSSSSLNDIKKNLYIPSESNYPDIINGNFIIAGHSGNYSNSFFRDLYKLALDDKIIIYYNNKTYNYKIVKIYNVNKTGTIRINKNFNKTTVTLITCMQNDNTMQTIYIGELI